MLTDLHNNVKFSRGISPAAAVTNNDPFVSQILDTQGFTQHELVVQLGSIADADVTFTILVEDGNDSGLSDAAAVDDAFLLGTESPAFLFSDDNKTFKIGYVGPKRYVRVTITPAANTGNIFLSGTWVQSGGRKPPYSTQIN